MSLKESKDETVTINDNSNEIKVTNCNDKEMVYKQDAIDALNESIKHFDDMAEECRRNANIEQNDYMDMRDAATEYRQLSIWLNELKWLRERFQSQPDSKELSSTHKALDTISRQAAIEAIERNSCNTQRAIDAVNALPSAQPEIIRCRNCKFASGDSRICMKFGHSPIGELDFCAWAERRTE